MGIEKRRFKRISVELPVSVYFFDCKAQTRMGEPLAGLINNFSPVGAALTVDTILLNGRHLFYTCHDNPETVIELEFELRSKPGRIIQLQAAPVWFDRNLESDKKQFIMGLNFLTSPKSEAIKSLCREACRDETMLVSLWKKIF